jgi:hypothetical protein
MSDVYDQSPAMMAARGQVAKGQTYGKRKQQEQALQAVPMAPSPTGIPQPVRRPRPNAPGSLTAPTARPNEPITAGAPFGAGPGPMGAGIPELGQDEDDALIEMRAIYRMYPSQELADIIQFYEESL